MEDVDRLARIERRLDSIERRLGIKSTVASSPDKEIPKNKPESISPPEAIKVIDKSPEWEGFPKEKQGEGINATAVLGWSGVAALILASAYFIRLSIDSGWLTPARQMGLSALFGVILIGLGFFLKSGGRRYSSLLPAAGIVVLFLSAYGAHLYYGLIGAVSAAVAIIVICLMTLAIGQIFSTEWYVILAVIGSYTSPIFLKNFRVSPGELTIYFSAWSILYSIYAVLFRHRLTYLVAGYLSFITFDMLWKSGQPTDWVISLIFQFIQFIIFSSATVVYSIRNRDPLDESTALVHLPILLIFYGVQYSVLKSFLPQWAPWIAFSSMGALIIVYGITQRFFQEKLMAGRLLVTAYSAIVLFHAGYLELVPGAIAPWFAFFLILILAIHRFLGGEIKSTWPLYVVVALIFVQNNGRLLIGWELKAIPGFQVLIPLYAASLYAGYGLLRNKTEFYKVVEWFLYFGHLNTMLGSTRIFDSPFVISLIWGAVAITSLVISIRIGDRLLGRSALFVFGGLALKVMLFDLSNARPPVRIASLLVLGAVLYGGGLLYQKIQTGSNPKVQHP